MKTEMLANGNLCKDRKLFSRNERRTKARSETETETETESDSESESEKEANVCKVKKI